MAKQPGVKLPRAAYKWALKHLMAEGDTDLFPRAFEIDAIRFGWADVLGKLADLDLTQYAWRGYRRFVVPKAKQAFRAATQLAPMDSLILAALVKKYGGKIEQSRVPAAEGRVFSYRFDPQPDGRFYGTSSAWHEFWKASLRKAKRKKCTWVTIADVADFYNQVYHHVLENELVRAGVPEAVMRVILRALKNVTQRVSRGIPVGPHSVHLLGECALIPVDGSLRSGGREYCRYVDDVHFFCQSKGEAEAVLADFAKLLDQHGRLMLQNAKTKILPAGKFVGLAESMLADRPLDENEERIIKLVRKHSSGDPYASVSPADLSKRDRDALAGTKLEELLRQYLSAKPVDYQRVGWLLRRLAQVAAPGAIDFVLARIDKLGPVLPDVVRYIVHASRSYLGDLQQGGARVVKALAVPIVAHNEYLQAVLVNLIAKVPDLDHIGACLALYDSAGPSVRREIVLAAAAADQAHWVKERKDEFASGDPWFRCALVSAAPRLAGDEGRHWVGGLKPTMSGMEKLVAKWAFRSKGMDVGDISLG